MPHQLKSALRKIQVFLLFTVFSLSGFHCLGLALSDDTNSINRQIHKDTLLSRLKFSSYIDVYYARYTDSVGPGKFQKFGFVSPISNTFGINIAQITGEYSSNRIRSTVTIQFGDLPRAVWSPVYNYIQEANAGVKLFKNVWFDAGFFRSHIGTESLLPRDNICSSMSVISWCEPFCQAGLRFTYTPCDKFTGALYIVNGYNEFIVANKKKAAGLAITYNITDHCNVQYNDLLSDDTPDSISMSHWRFLNNFVFNIETNKIKFQVGVDYITQQNSDIGYAYNAYVYSTATMASIIYTMRYQCFKRFAIYGRFEALFDQQGILIEPDSYNFNNPAYNLTGETFGMEYKPAENSYIRLEGRKIEMAPGENIFYTNGNYVSTREEAMINMGISF